jgi:hypothetical protein
MFASILKNEQRSLLRSPNIREILEKILQSQEFIDSNSSGRLLRYLVNHSLKGLNPREKLIAIEVFDKTRKFNPSEDTIVRVAAHKLRKKLSYYYQTEGRKDRIRLTIPKRTYRILFQPNKRRSPLSIRHPLVIINGLALLVFIGFLLLSFHNRKKYLFEASVSFSREDPVWGDIIFSLKPVLIVLGTSFFYEEYRRDIQRTRYIRDLAVNNIDDFTEFRTAQPLPGNELEILDRCHYLPEYGAYSLTEILPIFYAANKPFEIRLSAQVSTEDLNKYHILFIGYYKTLHLFKEYFKSSHYRISIHPEKLIYKPEKSDTLETFAPYGNPTEYHGDYSMLIKVTGPNQNKMILCLGARLAGVTKIVKNIASVERTTQIHRALFEKYHKVPAHFELLYHVVGLGRSDLDSELIRIEELDPRIHILGSSPFAHVSR